MYTWKTRIFYTTPTPINRLTFYRVWTSYTTPVQNKSYRRWTPPTKGWRRGLAVTAKYLNHRTLTPKMKAVFEVKTIEAEWAPPFRKNIDTQEYTASENEGFDRIRRNGNNETVFKVLQVQDDRVKVGYSSLFTIKSPEGQGNSSAIWVQKDQEQALSYLWGEKGITKKIVYKGLAPTEMEDRFKEASTETTEPQEQQTQEEPEETASTTEEPKTEEVSPMQNLFE